MFKIINIIILAMFSHKQLVIRFPTSIIEFPDFNNFIMDNNTKEALQTIVGLATTGFMFFVLMKYLNKHFDNDDHDN